MSVQQQQQNNGGGFATIVPPLRPAAEGSNDNNNNMKRSKSQTFKIFVVLVAFGLWTFLSAHLNGLIHSDSARTTAALLDSSLPRIETRSLRTGSSHDDTNSMILHAQSSSSSASTLSNTNPHEAFQEAWYIADEPDMEAFDYIYEDEHILALKHNTSYRPYKVPEIQAKKGNKTRTKPYLQGTGIHPIFTGLRSLGDAVSYFNPTCFRYQFPNLAAFPTISVILPVQNERPGLLTLTVHSILARTPPSILKEIIIVDDNGELPDERALVDEEELLSIRELHPEKIVYIQNTRKMGCAGARLQAIRAATADVLVVVDSHVEMYSSTWAQHLLLPILENPKTMSMQTLDSIDDRPGHVRNGAGISQHWGVINDNFVFSYVESRFDESGGMKTLEQPPVRLPFETPFAPGSLFAIRRDEFWRLGGYDEGLGVWGGENTELAMKVWRCGFEAGVTEGDDGQAVTRPPPPPGRIVVVPCSRVGHVYRVHTDETGRWPPPLPDYVMEQYGLLNEGDWLFRGRECDNFTKVVIRNNMRIMRVWMGQNSSATKRYYQQVRENHSTHF
jgi:GT2 family glycosyltransferase